MITKSTDMPEISPCRIALIAHDHKKQDLREWARFNRSLLTAHHAGNRATADFVISSPLISQRYQQRPPPTWHPGGPPPQL